MKNLAGDPAAAPVLSDLRERLRRYYPNDNSVN
jgi:hypothetical protein